ncbi:MAG: hypothetical protein JW891_14650 [Candidatus Lokiarchaeota archaeon]|nr:hypothetical protein [Candidatus Lokiarchaeota archaeon]
MHFLRKIIETPKLEEVAKEHFYVHRHFYRYSKGEFIGPAITITKTNAKITIKGTHEYEDLIQEIGCKVSTNDQVNVSGTLETGKDLSEDLKKLGLDWKLKKSTGDKKIYKATIEDTLQVETLLNAIEMLRASSYLLISFNSGAAVKVTTKKRIPQPSKKKVEEDDLSKRVSFCTATINNTEKNNSIVEDLVFHDFKSDLPKSWKKATITNTYRINEIEIPKNVQSSMMKRILAIRKGKMIRTLDVDDQIIEKQYNIIV